MKQLFVLCYPLFFLLPLQAQEAPRKRPNVVLVIADDHRYDWMGHQGATFMDTPNLDRLASQGWSFPNSFASAGVCSPSRGSIFTGKYIHQASVPDIVWQNNSFLQLQEMFPQLLYKHGYRTGYIGKFHLGEEEIPKPGFDLWASFPFVGYYFDQTIWINGERTKTTGFIDDIITDMAVETIQNWSDAEQPFCLVVGLKSPHVPFVYPERMNTKYSDVVFEEPPTFHIDYATTKPGLVNNRINAKEFPQAIPKYGSFQEWVRSYTRLATTIDESVGSIMDALAEAGITDNTIFIYTSDQGYSLGESNLCEKHFAYEQVMRVPMVVKFPGHHLSGQPPSDMVSHLDIAPTILDYCLGYIPSGMPGASWRRLQERKEGANTPLRDAVYFDFWHNDQDDLPPMQAVRTERYKLIHYEYKPYQELYDLATDPDEEKNLTDHPDYRSVKQELAQKLAHWKKETGWVERSSQRIPAIYMTKDLDGALASFSAGELSNSFLKRHAAEKTDWQLVKDQGSGFDLTAYLSNDNAVDELLVAIPVNNRSDFDPFISLRISFPGDGGDFQLPLVGLFEGKEIYQNIAYKKRMNIPFILPSEEAGRKLFDLGYNPPLKVGENVILFKIYLDDMPTDKMCISAKGGVSGLEWL